MSADRPKLQLKIVFALIQRFLIKSWINLAELLTDLITFLLGWIKHLYYQTVYSFRSLEKGKSFVAEKLYQGRGRFAKPFIHSGMGVLAILGIIITPLLANSFPSLSGDSFAQTPPPGSVLSAATEVYEDLSTQITEKPRSEVWEYQVAAGDTISGIAQKFGVSIDTIRWANNLTTISSIKPGQTLKVPPVTGVIHKVKKGDTIFSIAKYYATDAQGVVDYPFNNFVNDETFELAVGQSLVIPDGVMPKVDLWSPSTFIARQTPNAGTVVASGQFVWPSSGRISQGFRWYHKAVDIANSVGTAILAADAGTVIVAGWPDNVGYGNRVIIDHGNGYVTLYAHMSKISVNAGQTVNRGDMIGGVGSTGRSTGPHLHFEIRKGGKTTDPMAYLK